MLQRLPPAALPRRRGRSPPLPAGASCLRRLALSSRPGYWHLSGGGAYNARLQWQGAPNRSRSGARNVQHPGTMATRAKAIRGNEEKRFGGLDRAGLLRLYRAMVEARRTDDQEILLKRQNKIFFQISGAGHEGVQVAMAEHLRPGSDWFFLYYRDRALSLSLGLSSYEQLLQAVGAA